ncbi:hypothetical protein [Fulvivirga ligni]|uniref:hypothetical protein n=1 Tax=Fulvivirga ligni TaxID=2904246 RepID=UPI001F28855C|nr:hypothetical protein [Fulvivirga ligni]UII20495.1 hypothetical protein LVD16_21895 [Fulvivirga ligni]
MSIFTFHLVKTNHITAFRTFLFPPSKVKVPGLIHWECMTSMTLGAPVFSTSRILVRQMAVFAQWESEAALDHFLETQTFGKMLAKGWHTRMTFLRQWGHINEFTMPDVNIQKEEPDECVVAVTIARMRLTELPRFIQWGRPVEKLVRDHPGTTLSLAAIKFPRTVSTFSIWKSRKEMERMVHGHSAVSQPKRHKDAMKERDRKDFHFEFTTLRFRPFSEKGTWEGRTNIISQLYPLELV